MNTNGSAPGQEGAIKTLSALSSIKSKGNYNTSDINSQFRQAMQSKGINYAGEIFADGQLHRIHIEGHKPGSKNGAYILHADEYPAGWFMDFTTGLSQTWKYSSGSEFSYVHFKESNENKLLKEAEIHQKHKIAASRAVHIWDQSKPITKQSDHIYLTNKLIQPNGARLYRGALVNPIYNESDHLVNLQFINHQGDKRFLSGGRKRGCFYIIGDISSRILICEGFATGASLFEESGQCVVIAFDAGNLLPVSKNIRELAPNAEIILCGDNDVSGIGQSKAKEAALAIRSKVAIPPIMDMDWNDYLTRDSYHG